jgi:PadR family transcriptional regulator, regulatory protein PadR
MANKSSGTDVELMLLAVLRDGPAHGYGIIVALRDRSNGEFDFAEGTIYPALHRLEKAGLIESSTDIANGRPRRTYAMTTHGTQAFAEQRRSWHDYVTGVKAVIA